MLCRGERGRARATTQVVSSSSLDERTGIASPPTRPNTRYVFDVKGDGGATRLNRWPPVQIVIPSIGALALFSLATPSRLVAQGRMPRLENEVQEFPVQRRQPVQERVGHDRRRAPASAHRALPGAGDQNPVELGRHWLKYEWNVEGFAERQEEGRLRCGRNPSRRTSTTYGPPTSRSATKNRP